MWVEEDSEDMTEEEDSDNMHVDITGNEEMS